MWLDFVSRNNTVKEEGRRKGGGKMQEIFSISPQPLPLIFNDCSLKRLSYNSVNLHVSCMQLQPNSLGTHLVPFSHGFPEQASCENEFQDFQDLSQYETNVTRRGSLQTNINCFNVFIQFIHYHHSVKSCIKHQIEDQAKTI